MKKLMIAAAMLICLSANAKTIDLGMTKKELISELGKPSKTFERDGSEILFYGLDSFIFVDGALAVINARSGLVPLMVLRPQGIKVGDPASLVTGSPEGTFTEGKAKGSGYRYFVYKKGGDDRHMSVRIKDDAIMSFLVRKVFKGDIPLYQFRLFHTSKYKPTGEAPGNTPWPGKVNVQWDRAVIKSSVDTLISSCCAPVTGEVTVSARYSGEDCPAIATRIVISYKSQSGASYRRDFISVVPKAGQVAGEGLTGFLVYTNVNSGKINGWEYYGDGRLMYCDFPTYNPPVKVSKTKSDARVGHKLVFAGGESGISEDDWQFVASNRIGAPMAFPNTLPEGLTIEMINGEKDKFSFTATSGQEPSKYVDDTPLPGYVGRSDNLSSIIRLKESPLTMDWEHKMSTRGNDEYVSTLICDNADFCDYTLRVNGSMFYNLSHGKTAVSDIKESFNYRWYRGGVANRIDPRFPYAMPVAPGTKVKFMKDPRERYRSFVVLAKAGEPAFAMRGGRVCKIDNENCILVAHKDGTFSAYMNVDDHLVQPGDGVKAGDPIGKCAAGKLSISIFFLDKNKINTDVAMPYTHLTPYFRTAEGDVKLETGTEYVSFIDTDLITREMNGVQKKAYLKKKKK